MIFSYGDKVYDIPEELHAYLMELEEDSLFLDALRSGGVDNWDFHDKAISQYHEMKEERDRTKRANENG